MAKNKKISPALLIRVGEWAGKTHYECERCSFDCFSHQVMLEHLVNWHEDENALQVLIAAEENQKQEVEDAKNNINQNNSQG